MPIAFDPPASAPHGTLPARAARVGDDDAVTADIFTQLLLAAAGVQEAAASLEAAAPVKDTANADASAQGADPMLMLPLPLAMPPVPPTTVTIVATEKRAADAHEPALVVPISSRGTAAAAAAMPAAMTLPAHLTDAATALPMHALESKATADGAARAGAGSIAPQPRAAEEFHDAAKPDPATARTAFSSLGALALVAASDKSAIPMATHDAPPPSATVHAPTFAAAPQPIVLETVNAPAFTPGWQDETVNKLAQIVLTRNERAELKLNPAELGPVSIRVEMHAADQASILIVAASPETRSALEQSLPQLRDLLSAQGITLGQASVQDGGAQRDPTPPGSPGERAGAESAPAPRDNVVHLAARRSDRLVDLFA
jgi:flagellar hook-length control protein FliK